MRDGAKAAPAAGTRARLAWAFYDVAGSAFPTVIVTFVFAAYFTQAVAPDEVRGTELWGYAMSLSALGVALLAPVMGAIADRAGPRKPWIAASTVVCIVATVLLWRIEPDIGYVTQALILVALANFAFELGVVFYNAMLPDLADRARIGRWSGWAWGMGYAGGLGCLVVALYGLVQADPAPFGLDAARAEPVRATAILAAIWFAVFALPLFVFTPDRPSAGLGIGRAAREGVATLLGTLRQLRHYRSIAWYLLARMVYIDGLNTLVAFGGIFAVGTFGFDYAELISFAIAINVTAGLGAAVFGWFDDRWGSKGTLLVSLTILSFFCAALLTIESKQLFWLVGVPLGLFIGPIQSVSRTIMAHMAPPELRTEMFGLYALSGKATAFVGPALFGAVTAMTGSQRMGMATILGFLIVGGALLAFKVPPIRRELDETGDRP
ncbi:MAG: MFS transporter [Rhodospirillales bacterium]